MPTNNVHPQSLQELWDWTRVQFAERQASHLDAVLMQIGDRLAANPPENLSDEEQMVLDAWRMAGPDDRQRLTQLFMRTVGHQEFL